MPDTNFDADYWIDHLSGTLGGGNTTKADVERDILLSSEHKKRQGLGVGDYAGDSDWLGDFYAENNIGGVGGVLDDEARNYWERELQIQGQNQYRDTGAIDWQKAARDTEGVIEGTARNQGSWNQSSGGALSSVVDDFIEQPHGDLPAGDNTTGYGGRIGADPDSMFTMDFQDQDGDGIDDRHQRGPGQPYITWDMYAEEKKQEEVPMVIEDMYQTILGRDSDPEGKAYWTNAVESGQMTTDEVANAITNSEEGRRVSQMTEDTTKISDQVDDFTNDLAVDTGQYEGPGKVIEDMYPVSYTHLTLPTIYSV